MSYQPQDPTEHQEIINLLNQSIEDNKECCQIMTKYMYGITYQLNQQQIILRELLRCCKYVPVKPCGGFIPGQAIIEIYSKNELREFHYSNTNPNAQPRKTLPGVEIDYIALGEQASQTPVKLKLDIQEKGYFTIPGVGGQWKVDGRRIVNKVGDDLCRYLPKYFNLCVCDNRSIGRYSSPAVQKQIYQYKKCIELVAIRGYVIKDTSSGKDTPLLIYETRDISTGSVRTFEGDINLWKRYASR